MKILTKWNDDNEEGPRATDPNRPWREVDDPGPSRIRERPRKGRTLRIAMVADDGHIQDEIYSVE